MGKSSLSGTTEANKNVLVTGHLEANEKHGFTLTFTLENITTGPQDDDQEKTFSAKLKAEAKAVESELEG